MVPDTQHPVSALDFQSPRTARMWENKHKVSEFRGNEKELECVLGRCPFHPPTSVVVLFTFRHLVGTLEKKLEIEFMHWFLSHSEAHRSQLFSPRI